MNGKYAIVTGAGGTLGSLAVARLLDAGCGVLAVDKSEEALRSLETRHSGQEVYTYVSDVGNRADVQAYADRAEALFTKVDFFFNNAGVEGPVAEIQDIQPKDFQALLDVNVAGVLNGMATVLPIMRRGGSIVNTGSTASLAGAVGMGAYVASKHAVLGLTRTAAVEARPNGIRVNAVCPTAVHGPLMESIETQRAQLMGRAKEDSARYVSPEAVIDVVMFLLSSNARAISGQSVLIEKEVD